MTSGIPNLLSCGVTIPTHNRRSDLDRTCGALLKLEPPPDEVLICADGCNDGTVELVKEKYSTFRLLVNETARGSIPSRDRMMREAQSDIILSLDDDSYPIEPDFVNYMRMRFEENSLLAVASFPQRSDEFPESLTAPDFGPDSQAGTFANCAAAIRRSAYLAVGGYPSHFFHMYEEPDFALRCYAAGYQIQYCTGRTVRHHYTPHQRSEIRRHYQNARNELWSVIMRCPFPYLIPVAIFRMGRQFGFACRQGLEWIVREPLWWASFAKGLPVALDLRKPLPWRTYLHWMHLVRSGSSMKHNLTRAPSPRPAP